MVASGFPEISKLLVSSNFPNFLANTVVTIVQPEVGTQRIRYNKTSLVKLLTALLTVNSLNAIDVILGEFEVLGLVVLVDWGHNGTVIGRLY